MAYERLNLEDGCVLTAEHIAHIEDGIESGINSAGKSQSPWAGKKLVVMGDSITWGAYADDGEIWWQVLAASLECSEVVGNGVGGSCFSTQSDYGTSNSPMVSRYANLPADGDLYLVFGGTNDYGHGSPLGTIEDTTDVSFYGAMHIIINGLMAKNPTARIAFMTPLHRYGFGTTASGTKLIYDTTPNEAGYILEDYRDAIIKKCARHGIPVIDTYQLSGMDFSLGQDGSSQFNASAAGVHPWTTDGLHPNGEGHRKLAERVAPYVNLLG